MFPYIYVESDPSQSFIASLCQNSLCESCSPGIGDFCFACEPGYTAAAGSCDLCSPFEYDNGTGCEACDINCHSTCRYTKYDCDECVTGFLHDGNQCTECPAETYANCKTASSYYQDLIYHLVTTQTCESCVTACLECTGGSEASCSICKDGCYLESSKYYYCYPFNFFFLLDIGCLECAEGCDDCSGPQYSDCASCADNYFGDSGILHCTFLTLTIVLSFSD